MAISSKLLVVDSCWLIDTSPNVFRTVERLAAVGEPSRTEALILVRGPKYVSSNWKSLNIAIIDK